MRLSCRALEKATCNFCVNDIFQGRAPGRILGVDVEAEEIAEGPSAPGADPALAGPHRVGRARAAHAGGGDADDRHPARRSSQPLRRPLPAAPGRVGPAHRPDPPRLLWTAHDRAPARDQRCHHGRFRRPHRGRRHQRPDIGLGGLFRAQSQRAGKPARRCSPTPAPRASPGS